MLLCIARYVVNQTNEHHYYYYYDHCNILLRRYLRMNICMNAATLVDCTELIHLRSVKNLPP